MISSSVSAPPRSLWTDTAGRPVILDQRYLPHEERTETLHSLADVLTAIREMRVRGAPLIGVTAAYGLALALQESEALQAPAETLQQAAIALKATRPTAVNLAWAVDRTVTALLQGLQQGRYSPSTLPEAALELAHALAEEDLQTCRAIGRQGLALLRTLQADHPERPLQMLTHCNAGGLGCVAYGTATAPLYLAAEEGFPVHVWVDETRPRNQGALTAYELRRIGIPHTYIVDNAGGLLMQQGRVDVVVVGADRVSLDGNVANKIGTYLKALAAHASGIPFYVALPSSTFDPRLRNALQEVEIEDRAAEEVTHMQGLDATGTWARVRLVPEGTLVVNPGFDITPAHLITGLITERGVCQARREDILRLYPEWNTAEA